MSPRAVLAVVLLAGCTPPPEPSPAAALETTLERLRSQQLPARPAGLPTPPFADARLGEEAARALREAMQPCAPKPAGGWGDVGAVQIVATYDAGGLVRFAEPAEEDRARLDDPGFRSFAVRAARGMMDRRCARLRLPANEIGRPGRVTFRFRP